MKSFIHSNRRIVGSLIALLGMILLAALVAGSGLAAPFARPQIAHPAEKSAAKAVADAAKRLASANGLEPAE